MALDSILEMEEDKNTSYCWFDLRVREYTECRIRLSEKIQALERKSHSSTSIKSGHSVRSKRSSSSRASDDSRISFVRSLKPGSHV